MCTVTWLIQANGDGESGYDLFFNRDELKTRLPALPPEAMKSPGGLGYLAATDGNHGGTWLFVNAHGLTVCLLNYYEAAANHLPHSGRMAESRGHLVLSLVDCFDSLSVHADLKSRDLTKFRPFHLIAISPSQEPRAWTWDGSSLGVIDDASAQLPYTTSSFDTPNVLAERHRQFHSQQPQTIEGLDSFHRRFDPDRGAYSVCMMRPDAQTWSISHIRVDGGQVRYDYLSRGLDELRFRPLVRRGLLRE